MERREGPSLGATVITGLSLENYRCWRSLPWLRFAPVTGLFGPNGAGKSAIFELLVLCKGTVESSERSAPLDLRALARLGQDGASFSDLVFGRGQRQLLAWEIDWTLPKELVFPEGLAGVWDAGVRDVRVRDAGVGAWPGSGARDASGPGVLGAGAGRRGGGGDDPDRKRLQGGEGEDGAPAALAEGDEGTRGERGGEQPRRARELRFRCEVRRHGQRGAMAVRRLRYGLAGCEVGLTEQERHGSYEVVVAPPGALGLGPWEGLEGPVGSPVKSYGFPAELVARWRGAAVFGALALAYERLFEQVYHLGPHRVGAPRDVRPLGGAPGTVGPQGERAVEVLLALSALGEPVPLRRGARGVPPDQWVSAKLAELGLADSLSLVELSKGSAVYQARVRQSAGPEVALADAGLGVRQVLPLLVLLLAAPARSTLLLEHPDACLHPAVQARLADVLLETARTRRLQVVLESHSEHLLQRLLRRVADGAVPPGDVALHRCVLGPDGAAQAVPLELNELGHVDNWPEGFFGDPLGDALAISEASSRRKSRLARARRRRPAR
jgi:hypothetical protein